MGIKVIKIESSESSIKEHDEHTSKKTITGQAKILESLKFDFNESSPVVGRQRNSYEQNKQRIAKLIGY